MGENKAKTFSFRGVFSGDFCISEKSRNNIATQPCYSRACVLCHCCIPEGTSRHVRDKMQFLHICLTSMTDKNKLDWLVTYNY